MRLLKFPGELAWWLRGAVPLPYRPRLRVLLGMPSIRQRRWWRLILPPVGFRYLVKSRAYFDHRLSLWPGVSHTEMNAAVEPAANLAAAVTPRLKYSISIPPDRAEPAPVFHNNPVNSFNPRADSFGVAATDSRDSPLLQPESVRGLKELIGVTSTPVALSAKLGFTAIPPFKIPPHPPLSKGGILNEMAGTAGKGGILNEMAGAAELKHNDSITAASERRITAIKLSHNSSPLTKGGRGDFLGSQPLQIPLHPPLLQGGILNEMAGTAGKGGILNEMAGTAGLKRNDSTTAASEPSDNAIKLKKTSPLLPKEGLGVVEKVNDHPLTPSLVRRGKEQLNLITSDHSDSKRQRQPQKLNLKSTSIGKGNFTSSSFSQNFPFNYLPYPRLERSESTTQTSQTNQPDLPANPRRSNPGEFFAELPASPRTRSSTPSGRGQIRLPANFWERHYLHRIHWHLFIR
ncbi:hypothetical protein THII_2025 [Thioploca ingrica]|uniref:Uncharacterized protein n=1 Tax=Thioploca ingrica TaxID=40754 RepID=A0A090AKX2_9GAMM|nr:hypothetical protein THII_2025 [Thioploca ingrica]